jgi:hypothetical protein
LLTPQVAQMTRNEMTLMDVSMVVPYAMAAYIYLEITFIEQRLLILLCLVKTVKSLKI